MKLNIEELTLAANEAATKAVNTPGAMHEGYDRERLKAFARLIVEQCAAVCMKQQSDLRTRQRYAAAIRKLLEAE